LGLVLPALVDWTGFLAGPCFEAELSSWEDNSAVFGFALGTLCLFAPEFFAESFTECCFTFEGEAAFGQACYDGVCEVWVFGCELESCEFDVAESAVMLAGLLAFGDADHASHGEVSVNPFGVGVNALEAAFNFFFVG